MHAHNTIRWFGTTLADLADKPLLARLAREVRSDGKSVWSAHTTASWASFQTFRLTGYAGRGARS